MRSFSVAALQVDVPKADNSERMRAEILGAKRLFPFVDMIVLGELSWFGPDVSAAVELPGKAEALMRRTASEAGVWLVAGSLYERDGDNIYNTCPVINPHGEVVLRYRKIYPFLPYEKGVASGDRCAVFEVPGIGKFGISICYDMWFPETLRTLTWMGAEVILHPSMTYTIDRDVEMAMARASAAMHQCYFIDVNVIGSGGGRSGVYGPGGEIVHQAGVGREVIPVDLDLDYVRRVRDRGWHGLGQVLKSYRDVDLAYPPYVEGANASTAFTSLGPMHFHETRAK